MKWKQLLIYLVVLGILAGYYFVEVSLKEKKEEKKVLAKKVYKFKKEEVSGIKILAKDTKPIVLEREKGKWVIKEPIKTATDSFALDNFLNSISNLEAEKRLSVKKKELANFGLLKPQLAIRLKIGDAWKELNVGDKNPTGSEYYATTGTSDEVYLIAQFQWSALHKGLFELRDKRLFSIKTDQVNQIELARDGNRIKLSKKAGEGAWEDPEKPNIQIKTDKVSSLIDSLNWIRVRKFIQETDKNLGTFGLDKPSIQIVLASQNGRSQTLLVGNEKEKGERYAKLASRPGVVLISNSTIKDLPKSIFDLEDRNIFEFSDDDVEGITLKIEGKEYRLKRRKDKWKWAGENASSKKPDTLDVDALLWHIKDIEHQGLASAEAVNEKFKGLISLTGGEGKEIGVVKWSTLSKKEGEKETLWVKKNKAKEFKAFYVSREDLKKLDEKAHKLIGATHFPGKNSS